MAAKAMLAMDRGLLRAGERVELGEVSLFSDGTAVKLVGVETFRLTKQLVDDFVVVDTDAVAHALTAPGGAAIPAIAPCTT